MPDEDILADILGTEEDQLEADEDDDSDLFEILEKPSSNELWDGSWKCWATSPYSKSF